MTIPHGLVASVCPPAGKHAPCGVHAWLELAASVLVPAVRPEEIRVSVRKTYDR